MWCSRLKNFVFWVCRVKSWDVGFESEVIEFRPEDLSILVFTV